MILAAVLVAWAALLVLVLALCAAASSGEAARLEVAGETGETAHPRAAAGGGEAAPAALRQEERRRARRGRRSGTQVPHAAERAA